MSIVMVINRTYGTKQTTGLLTVVTYPDHKFFTIEPPWLGNISQVSCIPEGVYQYKKCEPTPKFPYQHIDILNVPDRGGIKIHRGNYVTQTHGCPLPGLSLIDINHDGLLDVQSSHIALDQILNIIPDVGKILFTTTQEGKSM